MQATRALLSKKPPNFFDLVTKLPGTGVGAKLQRRTWPEDSFWTVTAVKPSVEGNHGKAWGHFTWKGEVRNAEPTRVRGTLKKVWKILETPHKPADFQPLRIPRAKAAAPAAEA